MPSKQKDLIGCRFLSLKDIQLIIDRAQFFKTQLETPNLKLNNIEGKHVLTLFCEPSTRTRVSFEMAIRRLGGTIIQVNEEHSSFKKGESLFDTVKNLEALGVNAIVIRHPNGGAPYFVSQHVNIPVINAGDGFHEHPTQALLDIFTMLQHSKSLKNKKVLILGDIAHSRVANSNIWALQKLGAQVFVAGPKTLIPEEMEEMGIQVVHQIDDILPELDFINVLRVQYERQDIRYFPSVREYKLLYGLNQNRMKQTKKGCLLLHPGPINRGIEIESNTVDGPNTLILDQVTNGVAVRMAVLDWLLKGTPQ